MSRKAKESRRPQGQIIVLFAVSLTAILLMVGVVIDGGYGLEQSRSAQNASDFAALAGARIVAESIAGNTLDGTDANVKAAIVASLHVNGSATPTFGAPNDPVYVDSSGNTVGLVGSGAIPTSTVGVRLSSSRSWRPFFLGIAGINSWTASAGATAKGGYAAGGPAGGVFPIGIAQAFFDGRQPCAGPVSTDPSSPCHVQHLTPGTLNVPGGFGWLKFGCNGYGLGQVAPANDGGCANNKPFLQTEITTGNSYGCCTQVNLPGSKDFIGSLPGNKASADCSYFINNKVVVTIAVWDYADGTGSGAYYHIKGFTGFQITACDGGKDVEGVWRQPFFLGPTTTTPGFAGQALAVQLVR
jgi:Flp pilus assembly protein TadG